MKDTPEVRDAIREKIAAGEQALQTLKQIDPYFKDLQDNYLEGLALSVRQKAEDREIVLLACKLTSLADLYEGIRQVAVSGKQAQKRATELESEATR